MARWQSPRSKHSARPRPDRGPARLETGRRTRRRNTSRPPPTASPPAARRIPGCCRRGFCASRVTPAMRPPPRHLPGRPSDDRHCAGDVPLEPGAARRGAAAGRTRGHACHRRFRQRRQFPSIAGIIGSAWKRSCSAPQRPWFILVDPGSQPAWQGERGNRLRRNRPREPAGGLQAHHAWSACANPPPTRRPSGPSATCCSSPAPAGPRNRPTARRT